MPIDHLRLHLKLKSEDTPVILDNVHLHHRDFPQEAEKLIQSYMQTEKDDDTTIRIVGGDFNNRCVQLTGPLLVGNAVPPGFSKDKETQGGDYTDGMFFRIGDGPIMDPEQTENLDFISGKVHKTRVKAKDSRLDDQRPFMCVSAIYSTKTIFSATMLDDLSKMGVYIGRSTDAYQNQMIAIQFPEIPLGTNTKILAKFLEDFFKDNGFGIQISKTSEGMGKYKVDRMIVFVPNKSDAVEAAKRSYTAFTNYAHSGFDDYIGKRELFKELYANSLASSYHQSHQMFCIEPRY